MHACTCYFMSTDIVGSVSSGQPRTYLMLLLHLAYSHRATVTSRRTLVGTSPNVRWLLYFSPVVIRWPAGTLARPLGSILPALHRSKVYALPRTLDAKDLRGGTAFSVPLDSHCQHCASLSIPFFQDSEKIFSEPRQGMKPYQLGMDSIPFASPLWQNPAGMASLFSKFSHIFIFNNFRYLPTCLQSFSKVQ